MSIIAEYTAELSKERQDLVTLLHAQIMGLYPNAIVSMKYKMPTYEVADGWVAIANQKNYVSLYTCSATHVQPFKLRHPEIKAGKGCINFKTTDTLPIDDIRSVISHAIENPKA